jgi:hypothetical protein
LQWRYCVVFTLNLNLNKDEYMWKLIVGFIVFAGLGMYVLFKGGDIDMSGEKHGAETEHAAPAAPAAPSVSVPAASAAK